MSSIDAANSSLSSLVAEYTIITVDCVIVYLTLSIDAGKASQTSCILCSLGTVHCAFKYGIFICREMLNTYRYLGISIDCLLPSLINCRRQCIISFKLYKLAFVFNDFLIFDISIKGYNINLLATLLYNVTRQYSYMMLLQRFLEEQRQ